jgi:hypothetical protein
MQQGLLGGHQLLDRHVELHVLVLQEASNVLRAG